MAARKAAAAWRHQSAIIGSANRNGGNHQADQYRENVEIEAYG
jgi:hypothetical protein